MEIPNNEKPNNCNECSIQPYCRFANTSLDKIPDKCLIASGFPEDAINGDILFIICPEKVLLLKYLKAYIKEFDEWWNTPYKNKRRNKEDEIIN